MEQRLEQYVLTWPEVVFAREKKPVVMYNFGSHSVSHVATHLAEDGRLAVDKLPTFGYLVSYYEMSDLGNKFVFLKGDIFPYWEALFLNEKLKYPILFLETGEIKEGYVKVVPSGIGTQFCLEIDGKKEYHSRKEYDHQFVVLK